MKHHAISTVVGAVLLVACGDSSSTKPSAVGSQGAPKILLSVEHKASTPRGALQATRDGRWLYTSMDACRYIEGQYDASKVGEIEKWLSDESLDQFMTKDECAAEQYYIGTETKHACVSPDVKSHAGQALIGLFQDTHEQLTWDGIQRECMGSGPGKLRVSDDAKKSDPKPPVAEAAGAGGN